MRQVAPKILACPIIYLSIFPHPCSKHIVFEVLYKGSMGLASGLLLQLTLNNPLNTAIPSCEWRVACDASHADGVSHDVAHAQLPG